MIDELETHVAIMAANEREIEEKKKLFLEKKETISKTSESLVQQSTILQATIEKTDKLEIRPDNIFSFINAGNSFQEKWIEQEAKRASIDECIVLLKKAFEDNTKTINVSTLIEKTRKLSSKQFKCIYKKLRIERKFKEQNLNPV